MKKNYVNNPDLLKEMKIYVEGYSIAKNKGEEPPKVSNYIGECILLIANRLANKPNFSGYSFKEEMISDGIENCLMYLHNFNPEKSNNPFAYFTQIIKFAFIRRIQKEKKQHYVKIKNFENLQLTDMIINNELKTVDLNDISNSFVKDYENQLTVKKKPGTVANSVNRFFVEVKND
jgi:hypothetical protein